MIVERFRQTRKFRLTPQFAGNFHKSGWTSRQSGGGTSSSTARFVSWPRRLLVRLAQKYVLGFFRAFPFLSVSLDRVGRSELRWQPCLVVYSRKQRFRKQGFFFSDPEQDNGWHQRIFSPSSE